MNLWSTVGISFEDMGMILVTVNYRLNSFGFFQLDEIEDGEISNSNFGFLDQQMALKWIHRNIKGGVKKAWHFKSPYQMTP